MMDTEYLLSMSCDFFMLKDIWWTQCIYCLCRVISLCYKIYDGHSVFIVYVVWFLLRYKIYDGHSVFIVYVVWFFYVIRYMMDTVYLLSMLCDFFML